MWVVENRGKFISGVFKEVEKLNTYLAKTRKADNDKNQSTYQAGGSKYPLFILESKSTPSRFNFFTEKVKALEEYKKLGLKSAVLYTINKDYSSSKPGEDSMGVISHTHLGDDE